MTIAGLTRRRLLRLAPPGEQAFGRRAVEEQGVPEQSLDLRLHLGPDVGDDGAHPRDPFGAAVERLQIVADRLFPRQFAERAQNGLEEPRHTAFSTAAQPDLHAGRGIDIDEAAVDLVPGRALPQRIHRRPERRIGEHRSVDQHRLVDRARRPLPGQRAGQKRLAAGPARAAFAQHAVELGDGERRECARKGGGGARREGQFRRVGQAVAGPAAIGEGQDQPVLGLDHFGG